MIFIILGRNFIFLEMISILFICLNFNKPDANPITINDPLASSNFNKHRNNFKQELDQLYVLDNDESNNLDRIQSSYTSSAVAAGSPLTLAKFNQQFSIYKNQLEKDSDSTVNQASSNPQKFHSGNLYCDKMYYVYIFFCVCGVTVMLSLQLWNLTVS